MTNKEIGQNGEAVVAAWLQKHGYEIIKRNFCIRGGEIDIIALKDGVIAFVEVKTRIQGVIGSGIEAVTSAKKKLVIRSAMGFLTKYPQYLESQPRFDVAEVIRDSDNKLRLRYIENAYDTSDMNIFL